MALILSRASWFNEGCYEQTAYYFDFIKKKKKKGSTAVNLQEKKMLSLHIISKELEEQRYLLASVSISRLAS